MIRGRGAFGVYRKLVSARIRAQLQYRLSFGLDLVGSFLVSLTDFGAIVVLFQHLPALESWTLADVAVLYGVSGLSFGLCDMVVGHLDLLRDMVRDGSFDVHLVRPLGSLFQVVSSDFSMRKIGRIVQSAAVLVVASTKVDVAWSPDKVLMLVVTVVSGAVVFAGIWVATSTIAFWTVDSGEVGNVCTYGGSYLTSYPIGLFGSWLRRFVVFLVPLAFVAYYPLLYVLGIPDSTGAPEAVRFAAPAVAALTTIVASRLWRTGVRHYRSTGS